MALIREKADAAMITLSKSIFIIQVVKLVDETVVGVEVLKQWQCLKLYGISLERYLRPKKVKLL